MIKTAVKSALRRVGFDVRRIPTRGTRADLPRRSASNRLAPVDAGTEVANFWSANHVPAPDARSVADSLNHYSWRNRQYLGYLEMMPVAGADGKVVLDFGCGPGSDLVGFGHYSRPARLIGIDLSAQALALARQRLQLHGIQAELLHQMPTSERIPLETGSVDLVHSSGVVHHTVDPRAVLAEFRRVLRPDGHAQIMIYHYDSVYVHLNVAYERIVVEQRYGGMSLREAFSHTTDGEDCPISRCYTFEEFGELAVSAGLRCEFVGAAISMMEMRSLPLRFDALQDERFNTQSAEFLYELAFNERGLPVYRGRVAGYGMICRLYPT